MDNFNLDGIKVEEDCREKRLYNIGVDLSPVLYFFVYKIICYGIENNMDNIFYQSREGETFIKVHKIIEDNNIFGRKIPNGDVIEVSRIATFAPSLKDFSISELMRLWSQYSVQSLDDLFKTLDIDIKDYKKSIEKFGIDSSKKIEKIWLDDRIKKMFEDITLKEKIDIEIKKKRAELLKYFETKGIYQDSNKIFVVDLGWRGTIQDNLAYIFEKKHIYGFYFALFDYYNKQPQNTTKQAFISDKKVVDEYIKPLVVLFEMLFNPESGSVVRYKDGKAIRKIKQTEYNTVIDWTSHIQRGMIEGVKVINGYMKKYRPTDAEIDDYIFNIVKKTKEKPPKELVNAYYSLVHNDTFGNGDYLDKGIHLSNWDKLNIIKTRNLLRKEDWKEAFFEYNHTYLLKFLLKVKEKFCKD